MNRNVISYIKNLNATFRTLQNQILRRSYVFTQVNTEKDSMNGISKYATRFVVECCWNGEFQDVGRTYYSDWMEDLLLLRYHFEGDRDWNECGELPDIGEPYCYLTNYFIKYYERPLLGDVDYLLGDVDYLSPICTNFNFVEQAFIKLYDSSICTGLVPDPVEVYVKALNRKVSSIQQEVLERSLCILQIIDKLNFNDGFGIDEVVDIEVTYYIEHLETPIYQTNYYLNIDQVNTLLISNVGGEKPSSWPDIGEPYCALLNNLAHNYNLWRQYGLKITCMLVKIGFRGFCYMDVNKDGLLVK